MLARMLRVAFFGKKIDIKIVTHLKAKYIVKIFYIREIPRYAFLSN